MRTSNPALNEKAFRNSRAQESSSAMSIQGTVNKTVIMLGILFCTATLTWHQFQKTGDPSTVMPWMMIGAIGGLILSLVIIFSNKTAPYMAPIYAALQGFFLGGLSAIVEVNYPGIAFQATVLTFGTLFGLLAAYKSGMVRATENFKLGVVAATGGIGLVYLASFVMGFFGINMPFIHEGGIIGIGFSAFVVVIAALNLVLDFDFIEEGSKMGAPKHMEWYAAFGLMVTLVWLYIEIVRLLMKLRDR
jgi:uncharacterized YccA/Bax inhibitor family protein